MVPRLSKGDVDRCVWARFIDQIKSYYKDDHQVEIKPNYILFKVICQPILPFEGHKFLSFSSNISGRVAEEVEMEDYVNTVRSHARAIFGSRIHGWNEMHDSWWHYPLDEVKESIKSYEQLDEPDTAIKDPNVPWFVVWDIPAKGKGLLARFDIPKGTRILCEKPLLTVKSMPSSELEPVVAAKLKALPRESQRQFLSLHNNFKRKHPFSGIVKTNALPCGSSSPVGGIYPNICLINHSCVPNSHNNWNDDTEHETIYAIRPIKMGEEITIPYGPGGRLEQRQSFLKESFGFTCTCSGCNLISAPDELMVSETRRERIENLDKAIGDPFAMFLRPSDTLLNCRELLQALDEEYNGHTGALDARAYYDAFQVCAAHGDQARASVFAERSYQARVICEGEESPETQRMKALALRPKDHASFGLLSMTWKLKRQTVPTGLDAMKFEKWLFRERD
ncbi:SET domain-containing protein [Aulographum hederae CBS 113979]|uniref:SET domain-containing protein n=1 Tax=Aulographum hederae CBS 113979 TaxID=1176131 RepID=A0A6G1GL31_9PEZI|nr:SET domain-containing protein [Aulographum hederae CBS 113979]